MNEQRRKSRSGFALVLVLALVALCVLATLALSALAKVNAETARASEFRIQARQNALVGLGIALGQLQRLAGPDDSITAQSSIKTTTAPIQRLTGVWLNRSLLVDPAVWLISGNRYPDAPLSIVQTTSISATDPDYYALVNKAVTAASDRIRAKRIPLGSAVQPEGTYAYWVGDEGCKASVSVPVASAITTPGGIPIRLNPSSSLSNFSPNSVQLDKLLAYDQLPLVAKGSNLSANFHSLTVTHYSLTNGGNALKAGMLNVNGRVDRAWSAWVQGYNDIAAPGKTIPSTVAALIASSISTRVVSGKKVNRGPFTDASAFRTSGILTDALATAGVLNVTASEILDLMEPSIAVRSDTFRIRAYGDVLSKDGSGTIIGIAVCEAIVQRTSEAMSRVALGRRFVVVSLRWLPPDEI